ncbi:MAG: lipopolysaccharide biosynthesis protein [Bacteroidota bacterium]|jgi:O-antigen/teichoic acid export membrane protein
MNSFQIKNNTILNLFLRNKILVKYISVSYLSIPVSLVTGFLAFRKIDPYLMGIWTAFSVLETYATFMRLGVINGMNRELPFALGEGDREKAIKLASTTLGYTLVNILFLIICTPFLLSQFNLTTHHIATSLIVVLRISLSFYITFLSGTFRSEDSFNKLSNIHGIVILMKLLFCPLIYFGFYGFLLYEIIAVVTNTILLHKYRPIIVRPQFHKKEFFHLLKIGFPVFIVSSAISYVDTIPKLYLIKYSVPETIGIYAPVAMLLSVVAILPNSLSAYMYPKFSFHLGQAKEANDIWNKLLKIYLASFIFIGILSLIVYFFIDYFAYFFPKYKNSLPYLKHALLICPFVFFRLGNMLNVLLKNYRFMLYFSLFYGIIQIISIYIISRVETDLIFVIIYSQVITSLLVLLFGIFLNRVLISTEIRKLNSSLNHLDKF